MGSSPSVWRSVSIMAEDVHFLCRFVNFLECFNEFTSDWTDNSIDFSMPLLVILKDNWFFPEPAEIFEQLVSDVLFFIIYQTRLGFLCWAQVQFGDKTFALCWLGGNAIFCEIAKSISEREKFQQGVRGTFKVAQYRELQLVSQKKRQPKLPFLVKSFRLCLSYVNNETMFYEIKFLQ